MRLSSSEGLGSGALLAYSYRVRLPRRGLQVQTGEVRYSYRHGISNADLHDARRVSITFRSNKDPNHHV